jgi:hypothetical protein
VRVLDALSQNDPATAEAEIVSDIEEAGQYLIGLTDSDGHIRRPKD